MRVESAVVRGVKPHRIALPLVHRLFLTHNQCTLLQNHNFCVRDGGEEIVAIVVANDGW